MRSFGGFRSSRRYHPNQKNEILNFRVVPDLQISKKVDFLMIYIYFFRFFIFYRFLIFYKAKSAWSGNTGKNTKYPRGVGVANGDVWAFGRKEGKSKGGG